MEESRNRFDALTPEQKKRMIVLLSHGKLTAEERQELSDAVAQSHLTDEESRMLKRAFALAEMPEEEREAYFERQRRNRENRLKAQAAAQGQTSAGAQPADTGSSSPASVTPVQPDSAEGQPSQEGAQQETGEESHTPLQTDETSAEPETGKKPRPVKAQRPDTKAEEEDEEYETDGSAITSLLKGVVYIVAVLVVSIFASWAIITLGNDMYAFVKDTESVTVVVEEDMTVSDVAEMLYENGLIQYPTFFELYVRAKKLSSDYIVGEYELTPSMSYKQLNRALTYIETEREQVVITIPEGYTIDQMIDLFLSYGIGTQEGFVEAINNYDYEGFEFIDELGTLDPERKYRLEGYLFPDTYYFFTDSSEVSVIYKLLTNFDRKVTDEYYERAKQLGMSMDEVITLASMIQAEGTTLTDFENISSVFHNRLDHPTTYPKLQSDATVQYILEKRRVALTADDLKIDSKYNTYLYDGLPPSAICNPSLDAIDCALYPADTNYYYFLADSYGNTYFSETLAQHEALKAELIDNQ